MKRLMKHQPERLDSVVGFACACINSCGCGSCDCTVPCTCTCTGGTQNFSSAFNFTSENRINDVKGGMGSSNYNTLYSSASSNIVWG